MSNVLPNPATTMALAMTIGAAVILAGCESPGTKSTGASAAAAAATQPPFGGSHDMQRARSLWREMGNYEENWDPYPGLPGWQPGQSPHGRYLKYYINSVAARNPESPGNGSIIVKENYGARNGPLMAVTVMQKIRGYDPDNADWFWVKFGPDGSVMKNPKGMSLAGRVAKGMPQGCIACHGNAAGGDYLFVND